MIGIVGVFISIALVLVWLAWWLARDETEILHLRMKIKELENQLIDKEFAIYGYSPICHSSADSEEKDLDDQIDSMWESL